MKRIESPSKRWAGYVMLCDPLNLEQVFAIEEVQDKAVDIEPSKFLQKAIESGVSVGTTWSSKTDKFIIPAVLLCVAEWHLDNFPSDLNASNFPASPRKDARELIDWLWSEINTIYSGEIEEVPNE